MKGKNILKLNHAEMMRAVEYYLNNVQFKESVMVVRISESKSNSYDSDKEFEIEILEADKIYVGE